MVDKDVMIQVKPHLKNLYRTIQGERSRKAYLRLDMNENVSGLPNDFVKDVIENINPEFLAMYPEYERLREKIAMHNSLSPENICLSNGSDAAIKYIYDTYVSYGDKVLLTDPTFAMYPVYCNMFNAEVINVAYRQDFSFPIEDFIDKISKDIKLAVIVNPNNPTGTAVDNDELIAVIEKAVDNDVLMIIDEAYFYFYSKSVIEKVRDYKNLIVLRTFSKLCGIASARLGYAAACPEIINNLRKVRPTYDINGIAILLADRILDAPHVIQRLIQEIDDGRKYLVDRLSEKGMDYREGCANFILIKCNNKVNEVIKKLSEKNILVHGGFRQNFLQPYIRVSVGTKKDMEKFWKVFINIWEGRDD